MRAGGEGTSPKTVLARGRQIPQLFFFSFSGCGVRVSECARPGGHCRARVRRRHTHRCPRLAGARVAHTRVSGWHLCPDARAPLFVRSSRENPTEPETRGAPQPPALPATSWGPRQPLPCSACAGVVWVLPDASLVTPGDPRSGTGARPPQAPPRVRFPGMTLSHRPCPRPRKEEAADPAPGTILPNLYTQPSLPPDPSDPSTPASGPQFPFTSNGRSRERLRGLLAGL